MAHFVYNVLKRYTVFSWTSVTLDPCRAIQITKTVQNSREEKLRDILYNLHKKYAAKTSSRVTDRKLTFEDDRGNLFFDYIKILENKRPKYFIAENVPNLLGISQGECYRIILEKISELEYSICWRVHPKGTSFGAYNRPSGQRVRDRTGQICLKIKNVNKCSQGSLCLKSDFIDLNLKWI